MGESYSIKVYETGNRCYVQMGSGAVYDEIRGVSGPILGFVNPAHLDAVRRKTRGWRDFLRKEEDIGFCVVFGNPNKPRLQVTAPITKIKSKKIRELPRGISERTLASIISQWSSHSERKGDYSPVRIH